MTEDDLAEANGLVARFNLAKKRMAPHETLFAIQLRLLALGVTLNNPVATPDPTAPEGGSAIAIRKVA